MSWGALPLGENPYEELDYRPPACVDCGAPCAPRFEHCDRCLKLAVAARHTHHRRRVPSFAEMIELVRGS